MSALIQKIDKIDTEDMDVNVFLEQQDEILAKFIKEHEKIKSEFLNQHHKRIAKFVPKSSGDINQEINDNREHFSQQLDILRKFTKEHDKILQEFIKKHDENIAEFFEKNYPDHRPNRLNEFVSKVFGVDVNDYKYGSYSGSSFTKTMAASIAGITVDKLFISTYSTNYGNGNNEPPKIILSFILTKEEFMKQITDLYIKNLKYPENINPQILKYDFYKNYDADILKHFSEEEVRLYLPQCFQYTHNPNYQVTRVIGH